MTNNDIKNTGNGEEPNSKNLNDTNTNAFDPKNLSDEDIAKVFDDPRIWEHKRFKELNDAAKNGKKAISRLEEIEKQKLEEEGKFKELAEQAQKEAEEVKTKLQEERISKALITEATKQNAVDIDSVLKLADLSKIEVSETGEISGAESVVKDLLENKPFLKNANTPQADIGSGTNPTDSGTGIKKFTLSQTQDPNFYRQNENDILEAFRTGNVVDDQSPGNVTPGPLGSQS